MMHCFAACVFSRCAQTMPLLEQWEVLFHHFQCFCRCTRKGGGYLHFHPLKCWRVVPGLEGGSMPAFCSKALVFHPDPVGGVGAYCKVA